ATVGRPVRPLPDGDVGAQADVGTEPVGAEPDHLVVWATGQEQQEQRLPDRLVAITGPVDPSCDQAAADDLDATELGVLALERLEIGEAVALQRRGHEHRAYRYH